MTLRSTSTLLTALSVVTLVGAGLAIPWLLVRLPADHFARDRRRRGAAGRVVRTVGGSLLIVAGIIMLALPGQGLASIVLGLWLMDLDVTTRLVRRLLRNPHIASPVNALRARAGQPPFELGRAG